MQKLILAPISHFALILQVAMNANVWKALVETDSNAKM